jgi:hypothetical protein
MQNSNRHFIVHLLAGDVRVLEKAASRVHEQCRQRKQRQSTHSRTDNTCQIPPVYQDLSIDFHQELISRGSI